MVKVTCGKSLLDAPIDDLNLKEMMMLGKYIEGLNGNLWKWIVETLV